MNYKKRRVGMLALFGSLLVLGGCGKGSVQKPPIDVQTTDIVDWGNMGCQVLDMTFTYTQDQFLWLLGDESIENFAKECCNTDTQTGFEFCLVFSCPQELKEQIIETCISYMVEEGEKMHPVVDGCTLDESLAEEYYDLFCTYSDPPGFCLGNTEQFSSQILPNCKEDLYAEFGLVEELVVLVPAELSEQIEDLLEIAQDNCNQQPPCDWVYGYAYFWEDDKYPPDFVPDFAQLIQSVPHWNEYPLHYHSYKGIIDGQEALMDLLEGYFKEENQVFLLQVLDRAGCGWDECENLIAAELYATDTYLTESYFSGVMIMIPSKNFIFALEERGYCTPITCPSEG